MPLQRWKTMGWLASAALAPVVACQAQETAVATRMSLTAIWASGGWIMWVLAVMSAIGAAFVIYFLAVLRVRQIVPPVFRADVLKKIIVQPMLEMLGTEADEEGRRELEQELETELMPQLRETVEKSKVVINAWLGEEVERIYAAE